MATRRAAALRYRPEDNAPQLVAKARGAEAERMLALAAAAGVSIVEDATLAALLDKAPLGQAIPESCWEIAAKILAVVLESEKRLGVHANKA